MAFNLTEFYEKKRTERSIISYFGKITPESISSTMQHLEEKLEHLKEIPKIKKKIYIVFLECFQNLYHHSHEITPNDTQKSPTSFCIIDNYNNCYTITSGNYIKNDKIENFKNHLDKINQLSKENLKEYYMEILNNGQKSAKDGAGLGMIDILRRAEHKLNFDFIPVDMHNSLFILTIQLYKN